MSDQENQKPNRSLNPMDFTWEDEAHLKRFVTETGKIIPASITKVSRKQQRRITKEVKKARNMNRMK